MVSAFEKYINILDKIEKYINILDKLLLKD